MHKSFKALARKYPDWTITRTKNSHYKWQHVSGAVVFSSSTPGDFRALRKHEALLKRVEREYAASQAA